MPHRLKSNIRFLDKSFQENQTSEYILSMMYRTDGFTFSVYHNQLNKFIGFFNFPFAQDDNKTAVQKLDILLSEYKWLKLKFSKVYFLVDNPKSTLVPLALFDEKNAATYLEFNLGKSEFLEVGFDILKNNAAVNVYYKPQGLTESIFSIWPEADLLHSASALLETLAINYKNLSATKQVFVNVGEERFEMVYFNQNKLHFYNSFKYKTKEDFIYFILAAFEQLSINPEEVKVNLMGTIDKSGKLYDIVFSYIRNVHFVDANENFAYSHVLDELQPHFYFVLFNVLQCG